MSPNSSKERVGAAEVDGSGTNLNSFKEGRDLSSQFNGQLHSGDFLGRMGTLVIRGKLSLLTHVFYDYSMLVIRIYDGYDHHAFCPLVQPLVSRHRHCF